MPKVDIRKLTADKVLQEARNLYYSISDTENACVVAKIVAPCGDSVCLRVDRDGMEIYRKTLAGLVETVSYWYTIPKVFVGCPKEVLWVNMVKLSQAKKMRAS